MSCERLSGDQLNATLGRGTIRILSAGAKDAAWKLRAEHPSPRWTARWDELPRISRIDPAPPITKPNGNLPLRVACTWRSSLVCSSLQALRNHVVGLEENRYTRPSVMVGWVTMRSLIAV